MNPLQVEHVVANGDFALTLYFVESEHRLAAIHQLCKALINKPLEHMCQAIPSRGDITLVFHKVIDKPQALIKEVEQLIEQIEINSLKTTSHEIPVCYHPELAADLTNVCQRTGLSVDELIQLHSQQTYQVSMLGFLPGFAYLSGNDDRLHLPRKATPDVQVPSGSIAIAGKQTGIYAVVSPGGWHVIGRTPLRMVDWTDQNKPMRLSPLDVVSFKVISLDEYKGFS